MLNALGERARLMRDITAAKAEAAQPLRDEVREAALLHAPRGLRRAARARPGARAPALSRDHRRRDPPAARLAEGHAGRRRPRRRWPWPSRGPRAPTGTRRRSGTSASSVASSPTSRIDRSARRSKPCNAAMPHRAVLPIENSTAGSVHEVYDLLLPVEPVDRRRRGDRGAALPARPARRHPGGRHAGAVASPGAGAVQRVPGRAADRRDVGLRQHGPGGPSGCRGRPTRPRRPSPAPRPETATAWSSWPGTSPTRPST